MTITASIWRNPEQVNVTDAAVGAGGNASQLDGNVIGLANGNYVVVWTDGSRAFQTAGDAVIGRLYNNLGNPISGETRLSFFSGSGDQFSPALTTLPGDVVAVAYVDLFGGDNDILVTRRNSTLGLIANDVIDSGAAQTTNPAIASFADGSYVVTYTIGAGADTDIVGRIVSAAGVVGVQFDIHNQTDRTDFSEVAVLPNGNFVTVYEDEFLGSLTDHDILYSIRTSSGALVLASTSADGGSGFGLETDPDVAVLKNGSFAVVWTDPDSTVTDIRAAVYDTRIQLASA